MPQIKVYHNPHFLEYRGRHSDIAPPVRPVAAVQIPVEVPAEQALEIAYRQTQHVSRPWWDNDDVLLHVRSTSVGDMLADEDGNLVVVESFGFQPYQPRAISPVHKLAEAYRLLEEAIDEGNGRSLFTLVRQALAAIQYALAAEDYPDSETPILWDKAQPGDLVGNAEIGQFRVIARKLRPKWRAKRLLAHIPDSQIWINSPGTWAVLAPVKGGEPPSACS